MSGVNQLLLLIDRMSCVDTNVLGQRCPVVEVRFPLLGLKGWVRFVVFQTQGERSQLTLAHLAVVFNFLF